MRVGVFLRTSFGFAKEVRGTSLSWPERVRGLRSEGRAMESFEKQYSVKEAAVILGYERDTVLRRIRKKLLKAWKLPNADIRRRKREWESWRISESELRDFMKRNENK